MLPRQFAGCGDTRIALPGSALEQVLTQAKALDMAEVRKELASREATP